MLLSSEHLIQSLAPRVVPHPGHPPAAQADLRVQTEAGPARWTARLWAPEPHGEGWRAVVALEPLLAPVAVEGPTALHAAQSAARVLRWLLDDAIVLDPEPDDAGPPPSGWRPPPSLVSEVFVQGALRDGREFVLGVARPNPNDALTWTAPLRVGARQREVLAGDGVWATLAALRDLQRAAVGVG